MRQRLSTIGWSLGISGSLTVFGALRTVLPAQALPAPDEHHIRAYGVPDGLLASAVRGLAQTPDGYLYVASGRGLARFDGYEFEPVALEGFASASIDRLWPDRLGRLWVLSRENDVGYLQDRQFHVLPRAPAVIQSISVTSDGIVWFGGRGGLTRVTLGADAPYRHYTRADGLPDDSVAGVFDLSTGERVIATDRQLARIVSEADSGNPGRLRLMPFGPGYRTVVEVRLDANGLWLAFVDYVLRYNAGRFHRYGAGADRLHLDAFAWAGQGESRLDIGFGRLVSVKPAPPESLLVRHALGFTVQGSGGNRWHTFTSADDRDELVAYRDGQYEIIPLRRHFDFRLIGFALPDVEGSLWVGTERGLFHVSSRKVFALTSRHGLAESFTVPVLQTRDGAVWVGTWGGGLHRFAEGRLTDRLTETGGLPSGLVRSLYEAADGTLWAGTSRGMAAVRDRRIEWRASLETEVRAFAEERDGTMWVGTAGGLYMRTKVGITASPNDGPVAASIWSMRFTRDGSLWVGSETGLFRRFEGRWRKFGPADGLRGQFVVSIHELSDGSLWFGTYENGLHRFGNERFAPITTREGLRHNGIWSMVEDGHGGVWMSSDDGVFRVEHRRLHAVADAVERGAPAGVALDALVFTEADGMPVRESNRASPGGWRLRDGRLVFNNVEGLVVIDGERTSRPPSPPQTVLQRVVVDSRAVDLTTGGVAAFPAGMKQVLFDFAALSFAAPEQKRYRYRLDGYDDAWVDGGTARRASYTNLSPGRYLFRVQSASGGSAWSEAEAQYAFVVPPLLWQSTWFRVLVAMAVSGLLVLAYAYRVRRLLETERLRLRIASDLHDDVGSSLSSIALLTEMLRAGPDVGELEKRQLQRVNTAARETVAALRDIIWLVDPQHGDLSRLVQKMRSVAADLLTGTSFTFDGDGLTAAHPLGATFMRGVLLIYKEALHNVVKHASASHVSISVSHDHATFVLRISDDGVGFTESTHTGGRGLTSMHNRAREIGGRLDVATAPGAGTRITLAAKIT